jgi:hypothetical protein
MELFLQGTIGYPVPRRSDEKGLICSLHRLLAILPILHRLLATQIHHVYVLFYLDKSKTNVYIPYVVCRSVLCI